MTRGLLFLIGLLALTVALGVLASSAPTRTAGAAVSGDSDCNEAVDAVDALLVLRDVAGLPSSAACIDQGNVKCDDAIGVTDALMILRALARLAVALPPGCPPIG